MDNYNSTLDSFENWSNFMSENVSKALINVGESAGVLSNLFSVFYMGIDLANKEFKYQEKMIINKCPNKKVVHLIKYGKKEKIRKKNLHRAIKIVEKIEKEN